MEGCKDHSCLHADAEDLTGSYALSTNISKTQIDRLGDRLRQGPPSESDVKLLDKYRRSFAEAYETVVRTIPHEFNKYANFRLQPTGRPAKSTTSIIEKLDRESIRLSQVQDIAGCRVVVANIIQQDHVVAKLCDIFPGASVVDRRAKPNYGYRAVHVIPRIAGKLIEIQVRTPLQHSWAELSEKFSDVIDPAIKYGRGPELYRDSVMAISDLMAEVEAREKDLDNSHADVMAESDDENDWLEIEEAQEQLEDIKDTLSDGCRELMTLVDRKKGQTS